MDPIAVAAVVTRLTEIHEDCMEDYWDSVNLDFTALPWDFASTLDLVFTNIADDGTAEFFADSRAAALTIDQVKQIATAWLAMMENLCPSK